VVWTGPLSITVCGAVSRSSAVAAVIAGVAMNAPAAAAAVAAVMAILARSESFGEPDGPSTALVKRGRGDGGIADSLSGHG
jgi:hypothetical protein